MRVYCIEHKTTYRYGELVTVCHNEAHLQPRETPTQRCLRHELVINPLACTMVRRQDYFGNPTHYFEVEDAHQELEVESSSTVEVSPYVVRLDRLSPPWDDLARQIHQSTDPGIIEARSFSIASPLVGLVKEIDEYARISFTPGRPVLEAVSHLCRRIFEEFSFDPKATTVSTPIVDVLRQRSGVCQDFAHLAIGCLRQVGLPARYVSGYIETDPPDGEQRLVGADASHAWAATFVPDFGWIDFDPTNNLLPADRHIVLAWGRDYGDVTPLKGVVIGGGAHQLDVAVDVIPRPLEGCAYP
ncbi:transglutaminase family protein [bacterium]|jgi:transglutaminase-like putative cysteine protease|nr:transglutaminase family protein [bacterium]